MTHPIPPISLLLAQIADPPPASNLAGLIHRILNFTLFPVGDQNVTVVTVAIVGVLIVTTWWISHFLQGGVERAFRSRGVSDHGTTAVTKRLLHYAVMAIGLTLAMQNIAQNFVSGLILLVERAIQPGDIVEVEGRVVRVLSMGIRTTVARTRDAEEIIIP